MPPKALGRPSRWPIGAPDGSSAGALAWRTLRTGAPGVPDEYRQHVPAPLPHAPPRPPRARTAPAGHPRHRHPGVARDPVCRCAAGAHGPPLQQEFPAHRGRPAAARRTEPAGRPGRHGQPGRRAAPAAPRHRAAGVHTSRGRPLAALGGLGGGDTSGRLRHAGATRRHHRGVHAPAARVGDQPVDGPRPAGPGTHPALGRPRALGRRAHERK